MGADTALHSIGRTSLVELIGPEGLQALDDLACSAVRCADANAILELFPKQFVFTRTVSLSAQLMQLRIRSQQYLQSQAFGLLRQGTRRAKGLGLSLLRNFSFNARSF